MQIAPQVLAAKRRHQPDSYARAAYWVDLDTECRNFQAKFPNRTFDAFTSCERRSTDASLGRDGYKPSTMKAWLREWHAGVDDGHCSLAKEMA